jgi:hypothetical protein
MKTLAHWDGQADHEREMAELREEEAQAQAQWEQERSTMSADLAEKAALLDEASLVAATLQARILETEAALGKPCVAAAPPSCFARLAPHPSHHHKLALSTQRSLLLHPLPCHQRRGQAGGLQEAEVPK